MIKPEYKELKDFPISNKKSEGIHYIPADFDNITIRALYNIEYVKREIPFYLNILVPKKQLESNENYPLLVYIQGSAWRKQNVIEHIIPLSNIVKKRVCSRNRTISRYKYRSFSSTNRRY